MNDDPSQSSEVRNRREAGVLTHKIAGIINEYLLPRPEADINRDALFEMRMAALRNHLATGAAADVLAADRDLRLFPEVPMPIPQPQYNAAWILVNIVRNRHSSRRDVDAAMQALRAFAYSNGLPLPEYKTVTNAAPTCDQPPYQSPGQPPHQLQRATPRRPRKWRNRYAPYRIRRRRGGRRLTQRANSCVG